MGELYICDSEGLIWLGHYKGVSCFNPSTESFINYKKVNTLISGCVGYVIQEDHSGKIWAGTTDGLYSFDKTTNELERFAMANGLPNNVICGLSEDFRHDIWISTYMGISRYDVQITVLLITIREMVCRAMNLCTALSIRTRMERYILVVSTVSLVSLPEA